MSLIVSEIFIFKHFLRFQCEEQGLKVADPSILFIFHICHSGIIQDVIGEAAVWHLLAVR